MKLILLKPSEKKVKLKITNKKDLWYLKQVLQKGDLVTSKSTRKLDISKNEAKRRIIKTSVIVTLEVQDLDYEKNSLKIKGKITHSSDKRIPTGRAHSFSAKTNKILKIEKKWNNKQITLLKEASRRSFSAKILACSLDEKKASIADISTSDARILKNLSTETGIIAKKLMDFSSKINPEIIVIASPDNLNKEVSTKLIKKAPNLKDKIRLEKVSSGSQYGIKELIGSGEVKKIAEEFKEKKEKNLMSKLEKEISRDLAVYGIKSVEKAIEFCAVKELLISENFFDKNRAKTEKLMISVKKINGDSHIISSSPSIEKLDNLGEIAAILRFKI